MLADLATDRAGYGNDTTILMLSEGSSIVHDVSWNCDPAGM